MKNPKIKIIFRIIFAAGCISVIFFILPYLSHQTSQTTPVTYVENNNAAVAPQEEVPKEQNPETIEIKEEKILPTRKIISVPFLVQAPNANWDQTHEEACEEASLLMVVRYQNNKKFGNSEENDEAILNLINYEKEKGYGDSITLYDLSKIASDYFGIKTGRIEKNITASDIKKELAKDKPVIVGAAGKILPNPNFRNGGPNYHMLVIVGYNEAGFITNDPGTKKGERFFYTYDELMNSIHDWDKEDILKGEKNYLVFD